jgi:4-aminobutyrate--pyruvate transaminase
MWWAAPVLQEGLRAFAGHPLVGEVRGIGLVGALELVDKSHGPKAPVDARHNIGLHIERRAQAHGVILRSLGDALTIAPPLTIEAPAIRTILDVVARSLDETERHARSEGWIG